VAAAPPLSPEPDTLLRAADAALYEAKRRGKDRVATTAVDALLLRSRGEGKPGT